MYKLLGMLTVCVLLSSPVAAQVSVNMDALDAMDMSSSIPSESCPLVMVPPTKSLDALKLIPPKKATNKKKETKPAKKPVAKKPTPEKEKQAEAKVEAVKTKETAVTVEEIKGETNVSQPLENVPIEEETKDMAVPATFEEKNADKATEEQVKKESLPVLEEKQEVAVPPTETKSLNKTASETDEKTDEVAKPETSDPKQKQEEEIKTEPTTAESSEAQTEVKETKTPSAPVETNEGKLISTLIFDSNTTILDPEKKEKLTAAVMPFKEDTSKSFRLLGYADSQGDDISKARRFSLARAISVRAALVDMGIHSTRIEIRALGNKSSDANKDKVDIIVIER